MYFQAREIRELNHPFYELGSYARVVWSVIQIDGQSPNATMFCTDIFLPQFKRITPKVTTFAIAKEQRQKSGFYRKDSERRQLFLLGVS
jgi:hypothetical protein